MSDETKIMVVEDEGVVALDIRRHLEKFGYSVTGIHPSGEEAVEAFDSEEPDLVLMDIRLQGKMDGLEAAQVIKDKRLVPVILLTAYADEKTVERAKAVEPFGYIIKPFEERELRTAIEMALYRHRLERRLQRSEERYRRFFMEDLSADFVADSWGNFLACNESFVSTFGYSSRDSAEKGSLSDLLPSREAEMQFWDELVAKRKLVLKELELRRLDGKMIILLANIVGTFSEENVLSEIKGYLVDISKRRDLEQQLRQAQKLEAVGRLAGGVAHDFNNILTVIIGYSTMIREKLDSNEGAEKADIDGIEDAARRASSLTRQLLAFSRRQILKPKNVHLNKLIRNLEKMIRRLIDENIVMRLDLMEELDSVWIDPGQLEQVLINLVVNARDAMPEGGRISISTRYITLNASIESRMGMIPRGRYVLLTVADTGEGIDDETQGMIFEPFFTTKPEDKGTGLGLSTVYGIVKQSGGFISLETRLGKGTTFYIYLPASEDSEEEGDEKKKGRDRLQGNERVLVVEDEESVRELAKRLLKRYGYQVKAAGDPLEALELCVDGSESFDLLITDMVMPNLDGNRLAEKFRERYRNIRILFMSGYPQYGIGAYEGSSEKAGDLPVGSAYITKPFEPVDFIRKIRGLLDA